MKVAVKVVAAGVPTLDVAKHAGAMGDDEA
jgi:hypothetical protein